MTGLTFWFPLLVMNLLALGVFTGHLTRLVAQVRPPLWSRAFPVAVLWTCALGVVAFDLVLGVGAWTAAGWTVYK